MSMSMWWLMRCLRRNRRKTGTKDIPSVELRKKEDFEVDFARPCKEKSHMKPI
jgi:hypothetical protein